jgi:hypothetical protein
VVIIGSTSQAAKTVESVSIVRLLKWLPHFGGSLDTDHTSLPTITNLLEGAPELLVAMTAPF